MLRGRRIWAAAAGLVLVLVVGLGARQVYLSGHPSSTGIRTAAVTRGEVVATVTGSGNLEPAAQVSLGFRSQSPLTEVDVRVGDHVSAGQTLARTDPAAATTALDQARAALQVAQAGLYGVLNPISAAQLTQLNNTVNAARTAYTDTANQVSVTNQQDATAVQNDSTQLQNDRNAYAADCATVTPVNQQRCQGEQATVNQDQARLDADRNRQQQDAAAGQTRVDQAAAALTSAQDALAVQSQPRPAQVQSAQAQVASAQAQVEAAGTTLALTTLTAPIAGTVLSINGAVGEIPPAGGGVTAQSPGSSAPAPGGPGAATAFLTIAAAGFQVVVPFAEADASKLGAGQAATVTFDAIPGLSITAHLLSIAPGSTVVTNVVNYAVTFSLDGTDPRLRSGMTANATVVVRRADRVLRVPNTALTFSGGAPFVSVVRRGTHVSVAVTIGLAGDLDTEIVSGLNDGDVVLLPVPQASPGSGGLFGRGG